MSWFFDLTGIEHENPRTVREALVLDGTALATRDGARRFEAGRLTTPSLADLRAAPPAVDRRSTVREIVADVRDLHLAPDNEGAVFQVASQFNLLEMTSPSITPEDGVARYETDPTQGPACAIACGAATIYRNYFHPVQGRIGQTADRQFDCLEDLGRALGNDEARYWEMRNGYAMPLPGGLTDLNRTPAMSSASRREALKGLLRVGVQSGAEVTLAGGGHCVTQVFCSALPVAYGRDAPEIWRPFAGLVLEAAYEATLLAAARSVRARGSDRLYLTMLGGGAFGNSAKWIVEAMCEALRRAPDGGLDIAIVSHRRSDPAAREVVDWWAARPSG